MRAKSSALSTTPSFLVFDDHSVGALPLWNQNERNWHEPQHEPTLIQLASALVYATEKPANLATDANRWFDRQLRGRYAYVMERRYGVLSGHTDRVEEGCISNHP
jgi:hypothetical protein